MKDNFDDKGEQNNEESLKAKKTNTVFYVALGICIIALAGAIYIGVSSTMKNLTNEGNTADLTSDISSEQMATDDEIIVKDVTKSESELAVSEEPVIEETDTEADIPVEEIVAAPSFVMPLEGEVLTPFSGGELVKSKTLKEWRTHDGIDIKSAADTPVRATADGMVDEVIVDPMWGTCVTISHDGNYQSFYKGLKPAVSVKVGQQISCGDEIGLVGNTAEIEIAEESHFHFAVKQDGEWIDPQTLFA